MPASYRKQAYHGAAFQAAVATLFGHKDYRHDLVTTAEVAAKTNVGAGATVEFRLRGVTIAPWASATCRSESATAARVAIPPFLLGQRLRYQGQSKFSSQPASEMMYALLT